ncbi:hypothetical protein COO60DRAFT_1288230 [Scenedesmus sp. NREL 46B-D3]|nr:hypothetical protein COO60DRAFT_1288230 [Scenedesmus sp. NREL 46B-D3]
MAAKMRRVLYRSTTPLMTAPLQEKALGCRYDAPGCDTNRSRCYHSLDATDTPEHVSAACFHKSAVQQTHTRLSDAPKCPAAAAAATVDTLLPSRAASLLSASCCCRADPKSPDDPLRAQCRHNLVLYRSHGVTSSPPVCRSDLVRHNRQPGKCCREPKTAPSNGGAAAAPPKRQSLPLRPANVTPTGQLTSLLMTCSPVSMTSRSPGCSQTAVVQHKMMCGVVQKVQKHAAASQLQGINALALSPVVSSR